jgi:hypothetical protein
MPSIADAAFVAPQASVASSALVQRDELTGQLGPEVGFANLNLGRLLLGRGFERTRVH